MYHYRIDLVHIPRTEADSERADVAKWWASVQSIPRTVLLDTKTGGASLLQWPVEELEALRGKSVTFKDRVIRPGQHVEVTGIQTAQVPFSCFTTCDPFHRPYFACACIYFSNPKRQKGTPAILEILSAASAQLHAQADRAQRAVQPCAATVPVRSCDLRRPPIFHRTFHRHAHKLDRTLAARTSPFLVQVRADQIVRALCVIIHTVCRLTWR